MAQGKVEACMQKLGYNFEDPTHLIEALNASGLPVSYHVMFYPASANNRLAVYGDSIMESKLCGRWVQSTLTKGKRPCPI